MSRLQYYRNYKLLTGKKNFLDLKFPRGNTQAWKEAYTRTRRNLVKNLVQKLYSGNAVETIQFNEALSKEYFWRKMKKYFKPTNRRKITISIGDVIYTLSTENLSRIHDILNNQFAYRNVAGITESDVEFVEKIKLNVDTVTFRSYKPKKKKNKRRQGAFFKYYIKDKFLSKFLKLERYGIYNKFNKNNLIEYCLIQSLNAHKLLTDSEINELKLIVNNRNIPLAKVKEICKKFNIFIRVNAFDPNSADTSKSKTITYGDKDSERKFYLGLVDNHYFINEKINITAYALKNYKDLKMKKRWNEFRRKDARDKSRFIDSLTMVKFLLNSKKDYLKEILMTDDIYKTQFYDLVRTVDTLEYSKHSIRETKSKNMKKKGSKKGSKFNVDKTKLPMVFFDCETTTEGDRHIPFLIHAVYCDNNGKLIRKKKFTNADDFLYSINTDSLLMAHNLGYDFRLIADSTRLSIIDYIDKGNKIMDVKAIFNKSKDEKVKLYFKDTAFVIPAPLKKFPKMFKVKGEKEVMGYGIYTQESIKNNEFKISKAIRIIKKENSMKSDEELDKMIKQFILNIKEQKCEGSKEGYFKHMKYMDYYCMRDCEILMEGYLTFRGWIKEITKLDTNEYISLPSIADNFLIDEGCYNDVMELSGNPRAFIQEALVGGRCMTRDNEMYHVKERLQDFDAVSLYPSAMFRMKGFLKGSPKVLKTKSFADIQKYDGYFIEVEFKRDVRVKRHFPLLSIKDDKGIRQFTNKLKGQKLVVDKTTLEDVMKFHGMCTDDFNILRGYYFDEGFNVGIKNKIEFLFSKRLEKKKEGNPIQAIYKLLMNAVYGKTIMKPIDTQTKIIFGKERCDDYVYRNHNFVKYCTCIGGDKWIVKSIKPINDHFSRPHVGCAILSMSKRIMNEVICLAEDNNLEIYYQDTDSMHILENQVVTLIDLYRKEYNKELEGKKMGQFHCDFDFDCDKGKLPVSVESYFLGKKSYIDRIETINDGITRSEQYHIRLKGIPGNSIRAVDVNPMNTYKKMYDGEKIEYDLLKSGCKFEFGKNFSISSKSEFKRVVQFKKKKK